MFKDRRIRLKLIAESVSILSECVLCRKIEGNMEKRPNLHLELTVNFQYSYETIFKTEKIYEKAHIHSII